MFQLTAIGSEQRVAVKTEQQKNQFKYFITNPLLRKISISGILGSLKSMTGVILTPLVTYYFASKNPSSTLLYTVLLGAGSFVGMIVSMIIVPKLTTKIGTRKLYVAVNLINVLPNIMLFLLYLKYPKNMTGLPQTVIMFILTLIVGCCVSIGTTVQTLIISEAVDLEERLSGNRPTALFFSVQTFIIKIGAGISSLAASIGYAIIHFSSAETEALNVYILSIENGVISYDGKDYYSAESLLSVFNLKNEEEVTYPCLDVIFSPVHKSNVGFAQYVNSYYFNGTAEIISVDEDKVFRSNFICEHNELKTIIERLTDDYYDSRATENLFFKPVRFCIIGTVEAKFSK